MVYVTNIKQLTLELAGAFMVVFCLLSLHLVDCAQTLIILKKHISGSQFPTQILSRSAAPPATAVG